MTLVHICTNPHGRLKLGNRYVWVDYQEYCGPAFSWDAAGDKPYDPESENDPIWGIFEEWLKKFNAAKVKKSQKKTV